MAGQYIEPMLPASPALPSVPHQCEVCRQWGSSALCADCVVRFAPPQTRCARCGLRVGLPTPCCGECLRDPPPFDRTVCVADYGFPWDALIGAFKFEGRAELAAALAARLVAALQAGDAPLPQLVLPVPLSPQRLAERGYNQAWELARRAASALRLPSDAALLQRPLETAHQAELGRSERQRNLRTAFMVDPRRREALRDLRIAVVDDVMTTGATAREAASVLLRAGAAAVDIWVLARTPGH
jgi:ComF family protein